MDLSYIMAPLLGGVIGYITNDIAIRMLFRPHTAKYVFGIHIPFTPGIIPKEKERIAEAFDNRVLVFPSCESGNTIAFARGNDEVDVHLDDLTQRATVLRQETGLNLLPTLPRLQAAGTLLRDRLVF